jgi:hypothetical protein
MVESIEARWLLLIHQIRPKPGYLRVKIWRRLQRLGAVPVKNSVYVLPKNEQTHEDFQWVLREIVQSGGNASLCEARFVEGLTEYEVEELFRSARDADYQSISKEAQRIAATMSAKRQINHERKKKLAIELERLHTRVAEVTAIDFFSAPARETAEQLIFSLESRLEDRSSVANAAREKRHASDLKGLTWVTRKGIHVDRMASAWLVRRFIDGQARFKFVPAKGYVPQPKDARFDMYEAEFTHEGDRCTFEVLMDRAGLDDPALVVIAEIVHEIDLKDSKFSRQETLGIDHLIAGIAMAHREDEVRLERASAMFDDLYEYYKRKQN